METDYVIAGAGCAGLSLAVHLIEAGRSTKRRSIRIAIFEPRKRLEHDRSWCFWKTAPHPFEECVRHEWARWRVASPGRDVIRGSLDHPYQHIPSGAFYDHALARIEASRTVSVHLGAAVHAITDEGDRVAVKTDVGAIAARVVFDGRPVHGSALGSNEPGFLQHFVGWVVRSETPVFDPGVATLMDFRADQSDGIHFEYVLPFSATEALVEDTYITARVLPEDRYATRLAAYLDRLGVRKYSVVRREHGVLPMSPAPFVRRPSARVYRIGLAGGMAKPSTGFAFLAIQRFSAELAARLSRDELPDPPAPRSKRAERLDRIFLAYLARHPDRAPEIFTRLVARAPARSLVRFLSDAGSIADDLRVMKALPTAPLALEALRTALGACS